MNPQKKWYLNYILGFFLTFVSLAILIRTLGTKIISKNLLFSDLPPTYYELTTVSSPAQTKNSYSFWMSNFFNGDRQGIPLRVFQNRDLFNSIFPGFPFEQIDENFLKRYFQNNFVMNAVWSPLLNKPYEPARMVSHSWTGSLDFFEKFGADAIVLGNSETYHSIVPLELQRLLSSKALSSPFKLLNCTEHAQSVESTTDIARVLASQNKKIEFALWGYSFWAHYKRSSGYIGNQKGHKAQLEQYWKLHSEQPKSSFLKEFANSSLFPFRLSDLISSFKAPTKKGDEIKPVLFGKYLLIPDSIVMDSSAIEKEVNAVVATHGILEGVTEHDCDFDKISKEMDIAIKQLLKTANTVYLFIPPVTPSLVRAAPSCFFPGAQALLRSKANQRVKVNAEDWRWYDVEYKDYVFRNTNTSINLFDNDHLNYAGALKATERLGSWILRERKPASTPVLHSHLK